MDIKEQFSEYGYVIVNNKEVIKDIKKFYCDIAFFFSIVLEDDTRFDNYVDEIRKGLENEDILLIDNSIQKAMLKVQSVDRKLISKLYDMGTRPNKFITGEKLFFNKEISKITNKFFEYKGIDNPLLVKPQKGETLHVFTPGKDDYIHNLPIHQDFQYLGQSSDQLTFWLFLSGDINTGGVRVFKGSHKNGAVKCEINKNNVYEVSQNIIDSVDLETAVDFGGEQFQLVAIDSLLLHQSIHSLSKSSTRLTYIWRISNINSKNRVKFAKSF